MPPSCFLVKLRHCVGGTDVSSFTAKSLNYIGVPENHVTSQALPTPGEKQARMSSIPS
jgi:hypothetical protein